MDRLNKLDVYYHDQKIGTMALYQNRLAAFAFCGYRGTMRIMI